MIAFAKPDNIIAMPTPQGKSNEWYTPARYVEAAREVMNGIDLDPASCELANRTVKASRYYSKEDDGLSKEWYGRVWLNPPFGRNNNLPNGQKSGILRWVSKLVAHYDAGEIEQAILLSTSTTDTSWFRLLWDYPICFADHQVRFRRDFKGNNKHPSYTAAQTHGTIFVYLGPNNERFAEVFSEFGPVIPANVAVRRQQITPLSLWEVSK